MSIPIGLDLGNHKCVIAVDNYGLVDVLLDEESNRETPTVINFSNNQRLFGSAAASVSARCPRSTISELKRLIGRRFEEPGIANELSRLPYETCKAPNDGISVRVFYRNETIQFTAMEMLAMLLSHLKQMAEGALGTTVSNCVIGVPAYFTDLQRREYLNAAEIAGWTPLRLFHDGTATALGYGFYKKFPRGTTTIVVFVDVGHCDTQVTMVSFREEGMTVLSHAFDRDLGGRDFDEIIFQYCAEKLMKEHEIDVRSDEIDHAKACVRLRAACEKAKKVLSGNKDARVTVEALMNGMDANVEIQRTMFEQLSSELLKRIGETIKRALFDAKLAKDQVRTVELVGWGSRIPAIMNAIEGTFGWKVTRTINGSECVARGCALQCAMLGSGTIGKPYEVEDISPFSIKFATRGGIQSEAPITIEKGCRIPRNIYLMHSPGASLVDVAYVEKKELPPGVSDSISTYEVEFYDDSQRSKLLLGLGVDFSGIVRYQSASLVEGNVNNFFSGIIPNPNFNRPANLMEREKLSKKLDFAISESVFGRATRDDLAKAKTREEQLAEQDKHIKQAKAERNDLESYIYVARTKLLQKCEGCVNESNMDNILRRFEEIEDWLEESGEDQPELACGYMNELKQLISPIEILSDTSIQIQNTTKTQTDDVIAERKQVPHEISYMAVPNATMPNSAEESKDEQTNDPVLFQNQRCDTNGIEQHSISSGHGREHSRSLTNAMQNTPQPSPKAGKVRSTSYRDGYYVQEEQVVQKQPQSPPKHTPWAFENGGGIQASTRQHMQLTDVGAHSWNNDESTSNRTFETRNEAGSSYRTTGNGSMRGTGLAQPRSSPPNEIQGDDATDVVEYIYGSQTYIRERGSRQIKPYSPSSRASPLRSEAGSPNGAGFHGQDSGPDEQMPTRSPSPSRPRVSWSSQVTVAREDSNHELEQDDLGGRRSNLHVSPAASPSRSTGQAPSSPPGIFGRFGAARKSTASPKSKGSTSSHGDLHEESKRKDEDKNADSDVDVAPTGRKKNEVKRCSFDCFHTC